MKQPIPSMTDPNEEATVFTETSNCLASSTYPGLASDPELASRLAAKVLQDVRCYIVCRSSPRTYKVQKHASLRHRGQFRLRITIVNIDR